MTQSLKIEAAWEPLDEGEDEDRNCFAAVGIEAHGFWLTEGRDALANRLRQAPMLSSYHLAEWFAWNWWRLRWEPRASVLSHDWKFAHKMSNIGGGYIWPNITIFSDGEHTALMSRATSERGETPFRYLSNRTAVVPSTDFEAEVDAFVEQVIERLSVFNIEGSNLERLWSDVTIERNTPDFARTRKLEALMGKPPGGLEEGVIRAVVSDMDRVGESAMGEIAAHYGGSQASEVLAMSLLLDLASTKGFNVQPANMVRLGVDFAEQNQRSAMPAWQFGTNVARALRGQERLADAPIGSSQLAELLAVDRQAIDDPHDVPLDVSFLVDQAESGGRVVVRSKWPTGRRFELARLLGEGLMNVDQRLLSATRANTYRQKAQRAFAAEFLSPFSAVLAACRT